MPSKPPAGTAGSFLEHTSSQAAAPAGGGVHGTSCMFMHRPTCDTAECFEERSSMHRMVLSIASASSTLRHDDGSVQKATCSCNLHLKSLHASYPFPDNNNNKPKPATPSNVETAVSELDQACPHGDHPLDTGDTVKLLKVIATCFNDKKMVNEAEVLEATKIIWVMFKTGQVTPAGASFLSTFAGKMGVDGADQPFVDRVMGLVQGRLGGNPMFPKAFKGASLLL